MMNESRISSRTSQQNKKLCHHFNEIRKDYSIHDLTDDDDGDDHNYYSHHTISYLDDESTSKPIHTNSFRKSNFSHFLLHKALNLSKKLKYYIMHSITLFHEDLYGLSWSEAHDRLQSTYGISIETNVNISSKNGRTLRHFSTSVLPNDCTTITTNTTTTNTDANTTPMNRMSRRYSLQKHSRLYQLDKPYYIQCKFIEPNITLYDNTISTTNNPMCINHDLKKNNLPKISFIKIKNQYPIDTINKQFIINDDPLLMNHCCHSNNNDLNPSKFKENNKHRIEYKDLKHIETTNNVLNYHHHRDYQPFKDIKHRLMHLKERRRKTSMELEVLSNDNNRRTHKSLSN
ncbi:unnamed protein product [Schistosoma margrebowiei]|uniref:Fork-head domain-containing protein n=1 Tax=Schistosoma margrebowiei TaxID=48269 RepID=A0A183MGT9_9TREM|nr:unnamed protein product [Schistosoma margrebowiei]VDP17837.1 unnamed protein product [Schistosoma margrebowiei]